MNEKNILRRMAELGIADFETVTDVERQQRKFLRNLEDSSIARRAYAGFEDCSATVCGRLKCAEVCRFAAHHRRVKHIAAAHRLLVRIGQPILEVQVARGLWVQPAGKLDQMSIGAAKKWNQRVLDSLYRSNLVAVGVFKVAPATTYDGHDVWVAAIHQLVAGADLHRIKKPFTPPSKPLGLQSDFEDLVWVREIKNVGQILSEIFDYRVRPWRDPRDKPQRDTGRESKVWKITASSYKAAKLTKDLWEEYYGWRLALPQNICLIRYGCDRHFNKLKKPPRKPPQKTRKPHPFPHWLEPHWFGGPRWEHGVDMPRPRRISDSDADDINLEDDD